MIQFLYNTQKIHSVFIHVICFICICVFGVLLPNSINTIQAQDIHFTQNASTPLYVNPALTGLYNGDFRITADYRSQWASLSTGAGYRTTTLSADAKMVKGVTDGAWVSTGILLYNDQAGALTYKTNSVDIAVAYNSPMGDGASFVSFGGMFGIANRSIDLSQSQFGSQYDGFGYDADIVSGETIGTEGFNHLNVSGGAMYYYLKSSRNYGFLGGAAYNLVSAEYSFLDNQDVSLPMRLSLQAGGSVSIARSLDIVPSIYYMSQRKDMKTDIGTLFRFVFYENRQVKNFRAFNIGPYVRLAKHFDKAVALDAMMLVLKVDYDDISIGLSYDFNISDLNNATNGKGGPEVSLIYSPKIRSSQLSPVSCPRF